MIEKQEDEYRGNVANMDDYRNVSLREDASEGYDRIRKRVFVFEEDLDEYAVMPRVGFTWELLLEMVGIGMGLVVIVSTLFMLISGIFF